MSPQLRPYLEQLAELGVYGSTVEAVAEHLVREGIARELRGDGLLRAVTDDIDLTALRTAQDTFAKG